MMPCIFLSNCNVEVKILVFYLMQGWFLWSGLHSFWGWLVSWFQWVIKAIIWYNIL